MTNPSVGYAASANFAAGKFVGGLPPSPLLRGAKQKANFMLQRLTERLVFVAGGITMLHLTIRPPLQNEIPFFNRGKVFSLPFR